MSEHEFLAGATEVDITPPVGVPMDGYKSREGPSIGVHDTLSAEALLMRLGQDHVLLLTLDMLGVGLDFTRRVRARVSKAIDVREREVMVACTHTHSGPAGFLPRVGGLGAEEDEILQEITIRKLVGAAQWAQRRLRPARLGVQTGQITSIGRNRNDPEAGPMDPAVTVLRVDDAAGEPLALMMNYGCHPTVLGYGNRYISADYPGAAKNLLRRIYPETVFMFSNGASGDVSTRFTRRAQDFAEVQRMGRILSGEVLRVMQLLETAVPSRLSGHVAAIDIPFRDFPSPEGARRALEDRRGELAELERQGASHGEIRRATTKVEGAQAQLRLVDALADRTHVSTEVQVLEIGDLLCAGMPGEPFSRLVLALKEASPAPATAAISYANDGVGYFPDERSMAEGTYEALASPYGSEGVQKLQNTVLSLVRGEDSGA